MAPLVGERNPRWEEAPLSSRLVIIVPVSLVTVAVIASLQIAYVGPWVRSWKSISSTGYGAASALLIFLLKIWIDVGLIRAQPFPLNQVSSVVAWLGGAAALVSAAVSAASGGGIFGNCLIFWGASLLLLGLTLRVIDLNLLEP